MKKQLILILGALCMTASLLGCGGSNANTINGNKDTLAFNQKEEAEEDKADNPEEYKMDTPKHTIEEYMKNVVSLNEEKLKEFHDGDFDFASVKRTIDCYKVENIELVNIEEPHIKDDIAFATVQYSFVVNNGKINNVESFILRNIDDKWFLINENQLNEEQLLWEQNLILQQQSNEQLIEFVRQNEKFMQENRMFMEEVQNNLNESMKAQQNFNDMNNLMQEQQQQMFQQQMQQQQQLQNMMN